MYLCFVGFNSSFGGKWWGGYAATSKGDNYTARGKRVLLKQIKNLKDVKFTCLNYLDMIIDEPSIIYCDPPYKGTTVYAGNGKFDYDVFYKWCIDKAKNGNTVFISEYSMPEDFEILIEIEHKTILDRNSQYERKERLYSVKR